jgi:hypothetical protein
MAEKQTTEPTLTVLADTMSVLVNTLRQHTKNRNYLHQVVSGQAGSPRITVEPFEFDAIEVGVKSEVSISALGEEVMQNILLASIDHEERSAIATWADIKKVAEQALNVIERLKKQREEAQQKEAPPPEPATLKFPGYMPPNSVA